MSWESARAIIREIAETVRYWETAPLQACPNDGEPLLTGPDGRLFCPFDGWRPGGA